MSGAIAELWSATSIVVATTINEDRTRSACLRQISFENERLIGQCRAGEVGLGQLHCGRLQLAVDKAFFVFNKLEAWGEPVRASREVVAPRLRLRDFNFTSMSDAI